MTADKNYREKSQETAYLGWRADLLARLALARLSNKTIIEEETRGPFDYFVKTEDGVEFFVEVRALSSIREKIREIETIEELRWKIPNRLVQSAQRENRPVALFVFDADTGHGRFLRLDSLNILPNPALQRTVRLPRENTITKETLSRLIGEMRKSVREKSEQIIEPNGRGDKSKPEPSSQPAIEL
jgi:hypothetical protein